MTCLGLRFSSLLFSRRKYSRPPCRRHCWYSAWCPGWGGSGSSPGVFPAPHKNWNLPRLCTSRSHPQADAGCGEGDPSSGSGAGAQVPSFPWPLPSSTYWAPSSPAQTLGWHLHGFCVCKLGTARGAAPQYGLGSPQSNSSACPEAVTATIAWKLAPLAVIWSFHPMGGHSSASEG